MKHETTAATAYSLQARTGSSIIARCCLVIRMFGSSEQITSVKRNRKGASSIDGDPLLNGNPSSTVSNLSTVATFQLGPRGLATADNEAYHVHFVSVSLPRLSTRTISRSLTGLFAVHIP
ncbi:unnamed protein product [Cercospora beticola]|nr:unnamed protein product [Cercospora beticola]